MRRFPALSITIAAKQTVTKPDTGQDRYGNYNMLADIPSTSNINPASHIDKTTKQNEEKNEESEPSTTTGKDQTMEREPMTLSIISGNIHFLRPRVDVIAEWDADIILLQETKLAPHATSQAAAILKDKQWKIPHGKPCAPQTKRKNTQRTQAANEANSGGVAILTKQPLNHINEDNSPRNPSSTIPEDG